jgi:hypothetical protein
MFSIRGVRRATTVVAAATLMLGFRARARGRRRPEPADPNPGALTITGNFDFLNQYMFRGIAQHSTGMAMWPSFDLGSRLLGRGRSEERRHQHRHLEQPAHRRHR